MAFNPARLSLAVDAVGGDQIRVFFYLTSDTMETVYGAGYFSDISKFNLAVNDVVLVRHISGLFQTTSTVVSEVNGSAATVVSAYASSLADEPTAIAGTDDQKLMTPLTTAQSIDANAEGADFTPAGVGVTPFAIGGKLQQIVNVHDYGAVGDGTTSDAAAIAAAMDVLDDGGFIQTLPGKKYLFSGGLVLDRGIRLIGQTLPHRIDNSVPEPSQFASSIIVPVDEPIQVGHGAELSGWFIVRQGLVIPTDAASAEAALAAYAGTAVYSDKHDPHIHDNLIIGFDQAIQIVGSNRPQVYENAFDCNNGIDVSGVFDCGGHGISYNRGNAFLLSHMPWSDWYLARRDGTAIYIHDTADGLLVERNFSYGYTTGLHLDDVFAVRASHVADNVGGHDATAAAGTVGVKTTGVCNLVQIDQCHVDSHQDNYVFNHTSSLVQLGSNSSGSALRRNITLKAASGGELGRFLVRGSCEDIVYAEMSVGVWEGKVFTDATPSSASTITFTAADIASVVGIKSYDLSGSLSDTAANGGTNVPSLPINRNLATGFGASSGDIKALSSGVVAAFLRSVPSAVNWLSIRSSITGSRPAIYAEGSDTNIGISIATKGTGPIGITGNILPVSNNTYRLGGDGTVWDQIWGKWFILDDGSSAPPTVTGKAILYVDTADGDLKIKFGDGTVKTIVVDT